MIGNLFLFHKTLKCAPEKPNAIKVDITNSIPHHFSWDNAHIGYVPVTLDSEQFEEEDQYFIFYKDYVAEVMSFTKWDKSPSLLCPWTSVPFLGKKAARR